MQALTADPEFRSDDRKSVWVMVSLVFPADRHTKIRKTSAANILEI